MQTITTRFLSQTNTKPHRIVATSSSGIRAIVPFYHDDDTDVTDAHRRAVRAILDKTEWPRRWVYGSLNAKGDLVWIQYTWQSYLI